MEKILCVYNGNLILGNATGDGGADYDVDYANAEIIVRDVIRPTLRDFSHYGILISDDDNFQLLEYSWDGFQLSELEGLDALIKIARLVEYIPIYDQFPNDLYE